MSLFDTIGINPAINNINQGVDKFLKHTQNVKFNDDTNQNKFLRTLLAVGSIGIGVMALYEGFPLAELVLKNAPMPLLFSAMTIICIPLTAGLSLLFLIPIAIYSLPVLIQTAGAALVLGVGVGCSALAARSFSFI